MKRLAASIIVVMLLAVATVPIVQTAACTGNEQSSWHSAGKGWINGNHTTSAT
jgi:hypothetical protein